MGASWEPYPVGGTPSQQGIAEGAMETAAPNFLARPITRKTASSFRRDLVLSLSRDDKTFEWTLERTNLQYLLAVREHYKLEGGTWNASAQFLFRCLIYALDLEDHEEFIMWVARANPGPESNADLAGRILWEKAQVKTAKQIASTLKAEGKHLSIEGLNLT